MSRFTSILTLIAALTLSSQLAQANDAFHPSRARLLIHGNLPISKTVDVRGHLIPAPNLAAGLAPLTYLGVGLKPAAWIDVEPAVGWNFGADEPIISLMLTPSYGKVYAWTDLEIQAPSFDMYYFAQVDYKVTGWFHLGAESEGWGNLQDASTWCLGGGPNVLFRLGKLGVDLAVHARGLDGEVKPEFSVRFHIFL